jgi:hypothetical protein
VRDSSEERGCTNQECLAGLKKIVITVGHNWRSQIYSILGAGSSEFELDTLMAVTIRAEERQHSGILPFSFVSRNREWKEVTLVYKMKPIPWNFGNDPKLSKITC